jgi:hypothetical protein
LNRWNWMFGSTAIRTILTVRPIFDTFGRSEYQETR